MVAKVILTVDGGSLAGKQFVFEQPAHCVVGRAADCPLRLAGAFEHAWVSRHHCVLDIDPPHVRVQDLGSRNGTFVNGHMIGRRNALGPSDTESLGCELKDGDELGLGPVAFHVCIAGAAEPEQHPAPPKGA